MLTFTHPICLILIAGGSLSDRHKILDTIDLPGYVFVEAKKIYQCLDIAEYHHPDCIVLYFSLLGNDCQSVLQFLQFLDIPIILIADNLPQNQSEYFLNQGVFSTIESHYNVSELQQNIKTVLHSSQQKRQQLQELTLGFSVNTMENQQKIPLQYFISQALETAVLKMGEMLGYTIKAQQPQSEALQPRVLSKKLNELLGSKLLSMTQLYFTGDFTGSAQMLFSQQVSDLLVSHFEGTNLSPDVFYQRKMELMTEVGNVAINNIIGSLSNTLNYRVDYSVPIYKEGQIKDILSIILDNFSSTLIFSKSNFKIKQLETEGDFFLFFEARLLLDMLFRS